MANKVSSTNEIYLNDTYFPTERPVQSVLASIYPGKVVIGDTGKDSQLRSSIIAWSDWRGGIGIDRMEGGGDVNRAWWSDCQLRYKNHLVMGNLATETNDGDAIGHGLSTSGTGTGIGTIIGFNDNVYTVWNGSSGENPKIYVYNNTQDYWYDGRTEDQAIGVHADDSFGVPDQVTDSLTFVDSSTAVAYLVLAHYDTSGSGYSYARYPSYDGTNDAAWTNDAQDTKYITVWDDRLWGISHEGQLWYAHTLGTEVEDAQLPLPAGYCTGLFVARDSRGEPIIYVASKEGLWAHDAMNARFIKTEVEFPFHPHGGKGAIRWRDGVYFPSGLGLYKYVNGSNSAVLTVVGPDRDDGLPEDKRGTIMISEGSHNELLMGVDSITSPTITSSDNIPFQWTHHHVGSPVINADTGYSSILGYNELGWEVKWQGDSAGKSIDAMHVSNAYSDISERYRLWFAFDNAVYYMNLPVDIINPSMVDEFEYNTSGTHLTPWFNAGQSEIDKLALKLKVETQGCSSTETVAVSYAIDYVENYASMGTTITDNGITTYTFGSNLGTSFSSIRFKLELARTNVSSVTDYTKKSPDVVSMTMVWRKKLEAKWGHQVAVSLNRDYKGRTPKQLREKLIEAIESETLVEFTFRDDDGGDRNYYVDIASASGLESTGYDERGSSTIMLVEP